MLNQCLLNIWSGCGTPHISPVCSPGFCLLEWSSSVSKPASSRYTQQEFIFSRFWRLDVRDPRVGRALLAPQALGENPSMPLPAAGGCQQFSACLRPWRQSDLCLHLSWCSPVFVFDKYSSYKESVSEQGPLQPTMTSFWVDYICKDSITKRSHLHRYGVGRRLRLQQIFRVIQFNPQ